MFCDNDWGKRLNPVKRAIEKAELAIGLQINNLQATLFDEQSFSSDHSFEFLAAFIPVLHCICSAINVREGYYLL